MAEIVNKIAQSNLVTVDLEEWYPEGKRIFLDIKDWLFEGLVVREDDFRNLAKNHNWSQYRGAYLALGCSADAIIPAWVYLLLTAHAAPFAIKVVAGTLHELETSIYQEIISQLEVAAFKDKPVMVKGCWRKPVPASAYVALVQKIQPVAKSIFYGEACSSVPLYKRKQGSTSL